MIYCYHTKDNFGLRVIIDNVFTKRVHAFVSEEETKEVVVNVIDLTSENDVEEVETFEDGRIVVFTNVDLDEHV